MTDTEHLIKPGELFYEEFYRVSEDGSETLLSKTTFKAPSKFPEVGIQSMDSGPPEVAEVIGTEYFNDYEPVVAEEMSVASASSLSDIWKIVKPIGQWIVKKDAINIIKDHNQALSLSDLNMDKGIAGVAPKHDTASGAIAADSEPYTLKIKNRNQTRALLLENIVMNVTCTSTDKEADGVGVPGHYFKDAYVSIGKIQKGWDIELEGKVNVNSVGNAGTNDQYDAFLRMTAEFKVSSWFAWNATHTITYTMAKSSKKTVTLRKY